MTIDKEFQALIPALSAEELQGLEESILAEGCRDALIVWGDILIDGHNRYAICTRHGLDYRTVTMDFASREQAMDWMDKNQLGRRNLTPDQRRVIIGRRYLREKKASHRPEKGAQNAHLNPEKTADKIAKESGVDNSTVRRMAKDAEMYEELKATRPELAAQIWNGQKSLSDVKKEEKKETRAKEIEEIKHKIETEEVAKPSGKYDVIVIDPPWNYGREYDPDSSRVANPYPEMSQKELLEIELPFKDDCVLFLWTTHAFLWDAKELMDKWGFTYKATIVWDKEKLGMGAWFRMQCEFCLMGIKGKPTFSNTTYRDIIHEPRRQHSRKPDSFYDMVSAITVGKKIDWFSREQRQGWDTWGAENGKLGG